VPGDLTRDEKSRLEIYEQLLRKRGVALGLVAGSDAERLRDRHIQDSLRVVSLLASEDRMLCDIGPGAGLPGLVIAIARPDVEVLLVEPKERAVGFLELARDRLTLENVRILHTRVEDADVIADVATTRAFASLERSWEAATKVLRPGGRLIYFAGSGLLNPEESARAITSPEPPARVQAETVVADCSPLVIMTRAHDFFDGRRHHQVSTRG
jgi:16S rRNA (guanine527-N7)-methyltransferase